MQSLIIVLAEAATTADKSIFETSEGQIGILTAGAALLGTVVGGMIQLSANAIDRRLLKVESIRADVFTLASEAQRFLSGLKQLRSESIKYVSPEDASKIAREVERAQAQVDRVAIKLIMSQDSEISKQAHKIQSDLIDIFSEHGVISREVTSLEVNTYERHSTALAEEVFVLMSMVGRRVFRRMPEFRSVKTAKKMRQAEA